ncbi:MAG: PAS domain S-box protein [Phycisphaerales bacterium]|nr:MAG: PAS domain S-box protein [Phycisphaerales bacterium]
MTGRTQPARGIADRAGQSPADLLSGFADAVAMPVVLLTANARIRHANAAFIQTLDIAAEHYLHKKFPHRWLMHPQKALAQLREMLHRAVQIGANPEPAYLSLRSSTGSEIPTEAHVRPLPNLGQGSDGLIVVTFRNTGQLETPPSAGQAEGDGGGNSLRNKLKRSEERFRLLFEYAPDGYYLCDLNGRFVDGNRAAENIVGYPREELIGKSFLKLNLLPKSQLTRAARALLQNAAGEPTGPDEFTLHRKDGSQVTVEIHTYPVRIQGQLLVLGIARDITERKRVEEQLRRSEERFSVMADSAQDAIMMMDAQGRVTFYNKTAQTMFGWTAPEVLGKDLHSLVMPERYRDTYLRGLAHFRHTGQGSAVGKILELTALRKDGTEFPIEISLAGVELNDEWHAIGIIRDITERQQAQEAILKEKAFCDSVINSMPGVFYMLDEDGQHVRWNKNLERVTGYSSDEIAHIHPVDLFEGPDRQHITEAMATVFAKGQATAEADLVSKSGRKTPYFLTGVRVERDGKLYLIGLGIDITERRKAQAILEKLNADLEASIQELDRSNRELRDFAHITAHDLKAPLRGIATMADWLDQDCGEQIGPEGRENLHLLRSRVDRMGHLINGILRYSEIGHRDQAVEIVDAHALVQEVIEQIAPPNHIEIQIEGTLPSVEAERTRLTQVFQNLIGNAVMYIDKPQGQVRISARDDGEFWEFRVTDNGPGIEPQHFGRIFEMFQTLSSSDHSESTGLGLATVKKIVDLYGGRVWIESEIGHGSTFIFTLPKHPKHKARKQE